MKNWHIVPLALILCCVGCATTPKPGDQASVNPSTFFDDKDIVRFTVLFVYQLTPHVVDHDDLDQLGIDDFVNMQLKTRGYAFAGDNILCRVFVEHDGKLMAAGHIIGPHASIVMGGAVYVATVIDFTSKFVEVQTSCDVAGSNNRLRS